MIRISTPVTNVTESIQKESSMEGLSEEDEQFMDNIKGDLNKLVKNPKSDTVSFILNYSASLRKKRI